MEKWLNFAEMKKKEEKRTDNCCGKVNILWERAIWSMGHANLNGYLQVIHGKVMWIDLRNPTKSNTTNICERGKF